MIIIRRLFLIVGLVALGAFIATGVYLWTNIDALESMNPAARLAHRANHTYILFAALINLTAALARPPSAPGFCRRLWWVGAFFVLLSPALLFAAFFFERSNTTPMRLLTAIGAVITTIGVISLLIGGQRASSANE